MTINIKIAGEEDKECWDNLVERSPHGTIFHTWKFLEIAKRHTNSKLYPIIGLNGDTPIGVYPIFLQKRWINKSVLSPVEGALFLYLGPALADYDKLKQNKKESLSTEFQREINEFVESKLKYDYIRIMTPPGLIDSRPFLWTGYNVKPYYTYTLDISNTESVWKSFNSQVRINIRKTKKMGVIIKEGSKNELELIRMSLGERFIQWKKGYKDYLNDIFSSFYPENLRIFVGSYNKETVGGLILLCYKDKVYLWIGLPKTNQKGIFPNDLVLWESIKWASENGYKEYELMDAGNLPSLRKFKSKFNPQLSVWYSAEKYASPIHYIIEKSYRFCQRVKRGAT